MPRLDDAFGNWLAGFFDGEGSFSIFRCGPSRLAYGCAAKINLRLDDLRILNEIQQRTNLGKVTTRSPNPFGHPQASWTVASKADCQELCRIFDKHPLRAKKARDYAIWREAVKLRMAIQPRGSRAGNWGAIAALGEDLKRIRQYESREEEPGLNGSPQLRLLEEGA